MKVIEAGYVYELENFDNPNEKGQIIKFIHKEPKEENSTEPITKSDGTTNEEVLKMIIDRMRFLQSKLPSRESAIAMTKFEEGLMWLNKRTEDRRERNVEGKYIS